MKCVPFLLYFLSSHVNNILPSLSPFCVYLQVCLIPESAHGTNAASAQMAGLNVVYIPTDKKTGMVSIEDFKIKVCRRCNRRFRDD